MSLEECFEKGLLREAKAGEEEIRGSLKIAGHFLERAEGNMKLRYYDVAFMMAYNSMFHCARALIFSRGYKERSHACMVLLLKKKFGGSSDIAKFADILDTYRVSRHMVQYSGRLSSQVDAGEAVRDASDFLKAAHRELKR